MALACAATIVPGQSSARAPGWPFVKPLANEVRSFSTSANNWYAFILDVPKGKWFRVQMGYRFRPGATLMGVHGLSVGSPASGVSASRTGRSEEAQLYVSADLDEVAEIGYFPSQRRPGNASNPGGDLGGVSISARWSNVPMTRVNAVMFASDDVGATYGTHVNLSTDPGVKVIAESWGRGVKNIITDREFEGGHRAAAGASAHAATGVPVEADAAVMGVNSRRILKFQRAATAIFSTGLFYASHSPFGIPSWQGLLSVRAPDSPTSYTFSGRNIPGGDPNTYYTMGTNGFAGLDPGTYEFTIETAVGASGSTLGAGRLGSMPEVFLVAADADAPACSRARVQWREPDGHPVCGPGPWRMKRGLNP